MEKKNYPRDRMLTKWEVWMLIISWSTASSLVFKYSRIIDWGKKLEIKKDKLILRRETGVI